MLAEFVETSSKARRCAGADELARFSANISKLMWNGALKIVSVSGLEHLDLIPNSYFKCSS